VTTQQLLTQAIAISEDILRAIAAADLERVQQLEAERQPLIRAGFQTAEQISFAQASKLKDLNDEIVAQLTSLQNQVRTQQKTVNQGSKAARAYLSNSAG
jgi:hypothetical protein